MMTVINDNDEDDDESRSPVEPGQHTTDKTLVKSAEKTINDFSAGRRVSHRAKPF